MKRALLLTGLLLSFPLLAGQPQQPGDKDEEAMPISFVLPRPSFKGGTVNDFQKWVQRRLRYPKEAKRKGIQGRVMLSFKVNEDGSVSDVKVVRGVEESLDKEAVRVVSSSPKWEPAKGQSGPITYTFPVIFNLKPESK